MKNIFIYLYGLLIFDSLISNGQDIFAKDLNKNFFSEMNINSSKFKLKEVKTDNKFSKNIFFSNKEILEDLNESGNELINLLAFEQIDEEEVPFVDIVSDTQNKEGDLFTAKGNATIYLSDAILRGDIITYDTQKKLLTVTGNIYFKKGEQYFEASKLFFDLKNDSGYIDNVYGLIDSKTFTKDFELNLNEKNSKDNNPKIKKEIGQPRYINSASVGLVNKFENDKSFNITKADLNLPAISKWRYKTEKFTYDSKILKSKKIFFTNDIYNEPQFIFLSKNFSAEIIENKLKLISRNSWMILDDKIKIPIGRRSIFDEDPVTRWGLGADFEEKDGFYLFRSTTPKQIFRDYSLQFQPYLLIQRGLQGNTKSYIDKNSSVFSKKVTNDIKFSDLFALDVNLKGRENQWNIDSKVQLNSLNPDRLDESLRSKLTIIKRIDLENKDFDQDYSNDNKSRDFIAFEDNSDSLLFKKNVEFKSNDDLDLKQKEGVKSNFLDFQFYNIFREKVEKDFITEEIYLASGFNVANKKSWLINNKESNLSLIFDTGHFKSKSRNHNKFSELFRNTFVAQYNFKFPIWKKSNLDKNIDESYKFTPSVISQSIVWSTGIQPGLFLYSDGSSQSALKLNTGPIFTIGSFKRKFFDYTIFNVDLNYVLKGGESPFSFDNINKDPRINFTLEQQLFGPLVLSYRNVYNLDDGDFSNSYYALDVKRRAYKLGAFYNSSDKSLGIRFNIFNFDYSGLSPKF